METLFISPYSGNAYRDRVKKNIDTRANAVIRRYGSINLCCNVKESDEADDLVEGIRNDIGNGENAVCARYFRGLYEA